jgi:hypothetical protein
MRLRFLGGPLIVATVHNLLLDLAADLHGRAAQMVSSLLYFQYFPPVGEILIVQAVPGVVVIRHAIVDAP